jgi:hypothetical protein
LQPNIDAKMQDAAEQQKASGGARLSNWICLIDSAIPAARENVRLDTLPRERAY